MLQKLCSLGLVATLSVAAADLPWRFEGNVAREPEASVSAVLADAAAAPMPRGAAVTVEGDVDAARGWSRRASNVLERFDSRPASGFFILVR